MTLVKSKIGDNCIVGDGAHAKIQRQQIGIIYITSKNIKNERLDFSNIDYISEVDFNKYFKSNSKAIKKPQKNDVLLCIIGASIGDSCFVQIDDYVGLSSSVAILRANQSLLCPKYLYYWTRGYFFQDALRRIRSGSAQGFLSLEMVKSLPLYYPNLQTQQRIGEILSNYDNLIDNNNRRIALLEESIHLLYKDWFVCLRFPGYESVKLVDGVPEGWEISSIGNLSDLITRGITPKYDLESPKIVINQKCIRNYHINFDFARQHHSGVPEQKKIKFGDVLINSTGMGTLGRVAQILTNFENVTVDTHITIVRPKIEIENHFFGVALEYLQDYFDTLGEGATGQTELKRQILSAVPILLPNKNIRHQFDQKVLSSRILVQKLLEQNQKLKEARDLLLPRLMNGSITV